MTAPAPHTEPRWTTAYGDEFDMPGSVAFFLDGEPVDDNDVLAALNAPAAPTAEQEAVAQAHQDGLAMGFQDALDAVRALAGATAPDPCPTCDDCGGTGGWWEGPVGAREWVHCTSCPTAPGPDPHTTTEPTAEQIHRRVANVTLTAVQSVLNTRAALIRAALVREQTEGDGHG